jgi:hypothetical protein
VDSGDFVYLFFFVLWLLGQIGALKKKREQQRTMKQPAAARPARPTDSPPAPLPQASPPPVASSGGPPARGKALLTSLDDVDAEIVATLSEIDALVGAQLSHLVDNDYRPKAQTLRGELRDESSAQFDRAAHETERLTAHYREALQAARAHSVLRQRRDLSGAQIVADRLVAELDRPRNVAAPLPPPVAIVWDVAANDRLRDSALADSTLFVPRTVLQDASHWSLIAPEIARYLGASAPEMYQDIHEGLELGVDEAQVGSDPESLTRVLFASWIGRIVADAVGALTFGPSYLMSVAELYAQPHAPARVSSIVLNQDGTLHSEPPVHVRVHVIGRWLTRMGYASEASAIVRDWDERHGSPSALAFWGSMTSLPAAPVLDAAAELTDVLYQLPLKAFGNVRLAHVAGLAGWEGLARAASEAKSSLSAGERARGSARAIVAGAIEAALETPEANAAIITALHDSVANVTTQRPSPVKLPSLPPGAAKKPPPPRPTTRRLFARLTARDVGDALILGEIVLERPAERR